MIPREFHNDATQAERLEQAKRERDLRTGERAPTTYAALTSLEEVDLGGRFTQSAWPRLPAGSPFGPDPVPAEPPRGRAIDDTQIKPR
jgi:hypothetical protein